MMWDFTAGNNHPPSNAQRSPTPMRMPSPFDPSPVPIAHSSSSYVNPTYVEPHNAVPPLMSSSYSNNLMPPPRSAPSPYPELARSLTPVPVVIRHAHSASEDRGRHRHRHHNSDGHHHSRERRHSSASRHEKDHKHHHHHRDHSSDSRKHRDHSSSSRHHPEEYHRERRHSTPAQAPRGILVVPPKSTVILPKKHQRSKPAVVFQSGQNDRHHRTSQYQYLDPLQIQSYTRPNKLHKNKGPGDFILPYMHYHSASQQLETYTPRPEHPAYCPHPHPHSRPTFEYSRCNGKKRALCIGINYTGQDRPLRGCINDAIHVRDFLVRRHGFKAENIRLLTDDNPDPRLQPTKRNIYDSMRWLVQGAQPHDSLFFHYSGHGGQTEDLDGDEIDGFDETIFPVDYKKRGHIIDDDLHTYLVKPLPKGCRLTALFDSCHSGTVLDLPYIYTPSGRKRRIHVSSRALNRKATPADVISWSGCKDDQTSTDTFKGGVAVGAMSYAFITALRKEPNQSYQVLLKHLREVLAKFDQTPQLGSSHHIDTNLQFVV